MNGCESTFWYYFTTKKKQCNGKSTKKNTIKNLWKCYAMTEPQKITPYHKKISVRISVGKPTIKRRSHQSIFKGLFSRLESIEKRRMDETKNNLAKMNDGKRKGRWKERSAGLIL